MKKERLTKEEFARFQSWYSGEDISWYEGGFNPCPYIKSVDDFIGYLCSFMEYMETVKDEPIKV